MAMYSFILGIDISKATLDGALLSCENKESILYFKAENNPEGLEKLFNLCLKVQGFTIEKCLICIEATGVYCYPILNYATKVGAVIWMESATRIKKSMGIQRGKNDKIDAQRIAIYASRHQQDARIWRPVSKTVTQVKHLSALRDRLLDTRNRLNTPMEEFKQVGDADTYKLVKKAMKKSLTSIDKDITKLDIQLKNIIENDEHLNELFSLVTSVVGVGSQTALTLIVCTDGFKLFDDPRKLACYAGVVPFEYSSGTSVKGKTRVSKMANNKLKTMLHMAALSAVRFDHQLKQYYERKIAEGKKKMSILNSVKNKLLHRIMSVVTRKEKYENSVNFSLISS